MPAQAWTSVAGERFVADASKLAAAYKPKPYAHHKKQRAVAEAGLLKDYKYGATLADLRGFPLKPSETLDLSNQIKICARFLRTVARSWTLMLLGYGTGVEEAIKSLNEYVSSELKCVRRAVFFVACRYIPFDKATRAWESVERRSRRELKTVLYPALEPGGHLDLRLIGKKDSVTFAVAEQFLGIGRRQLQRLVYESAALVKVPGCPRYRPKVTTASLLKYAGELITRR